MEWLNQNDWKEENSEVKNKQYEKQKFMVKIMGSSMAIILIHHQTLVQYHLLMNFVPSVSGSQQRQW